MLGIAKVDVFVSFIVDYLDVFGVWRRRSGVLGGLLLGLIGVRDFSYRILL